MKRLTLFATGLTLLFGVWAFAVEQAPVPPPPAKASSAKAARITRMKAPGTVLAVSDTMLKIERKVKNNSEVMEFVLEKPLKVKVGDRVRVSYIEKEGQMTALRVIKSADVKAKKPVKPQVKDVKPPAK